MPKEYIERDELLERFERYSSGFLIEDDYDTALTIIHGAPIDDDLVEVVRCRDCKHWTRDGNGYCDDESYCNNPDGLDNYAKPDDYCSYGKRKDGADNA